MYEDAWYSFVPEATGKHAASKGASHGHKRNESLLQQPNGVGKDQQVSQSVPRAVSTEEGNGPPEASVLRRAVSCADCRQAHNAGQLAATPKKQSTRRNRNWEALTLNTDANHTPKPYKADLQTNDTYNEQLLNASQQEYLLYRDQLSLTERHLDGLITDANATLELLSKLSNSFQSVEAQTSTFQAQCEEVLTEQTRLEKLADEVGTDYYYYSYLENATRRLNAPGAGRLVDDESFGDMVENIDACVAFMEDHETYRERDAYLARYNALLTKCLHLLDHGFTTRLEKASSDIARQLSATKSESTRHALVYGRFEEMLSDSYALLPNIHKVTRRVYDQYGRFDSGIRNSSIFSSSTLSMLRTYITTRDRDTKTLTLRDVEEYQREIKDLSLETASRNYIKQTLERVHNENSLFVKVFNIEPTWNTAQDSVFQSIKTVHTTMVHPGNLQPMAAQLQAVFATADIQSVCNVVGWIANEYGISENDEEEDAIAPKQYREYAARLLVDHLWPFVDNAFEAEISKSITKGTVTDDALKIGPVVDGVSSSNAYPLVQKAVELLRMFDHAMPKERSSQNSQVVFRVVRETIQVLQQASSRIQAQKLPTDAELFLVKNLLIIKNELLSLEIGDIRSRPAAMQHFGQMWETLSPQNLVGFVGTFLGGHLWSRSGGTVTAKTLTVEDMNEQLDELLRQSIYGLARRWAGRVRDASQGGGSAKKTLAQVEDELEKALQTAFSNQPEVVGKLKEAIAFYEEDAAARSGKR
ncbi:Golgi complex component Cog3, putative [Cordyceps militaris CM01]|uniref:Conserved oligomeric Golgi complex subunit 3 n=1 Tax=Cordyceps militaris (strain CM01) TaxID=983644 RepID=G3J4F3_CORMM|nr:Golgi complex component Cog3, putative [Cordyceps militaris CM01]EGX96670.1 Golgi complex component Cog3, putative [Cordyceps militaris CM01]